MFSLVLLSGCTYTCIMTNTEGRAEDVVDASTQVDPTTNLQADIPYN